MALFRKLFYRKPPVGLLEICDRVYVFDCCFSSGSLEEENIKVYMAGVVNQLQEHFPDASSLVFNFREAGTPSLMDDVLSQHDLTIMDYPRHYEGCSLLPVEMMHHFLRSSESWLSLGPSNLLLMHCERGAWPVLAFTLAALLISRKQYSGEYKTLDMMYKQAPRELLHLFSPLNPVPSQLRYLKYVSRRNLVSEWPPLDRALTMDCVILRSIPDVGGHGGCRPIFRVYGQDPASVDDRKSKLLYSTPKKGNLRIYKQEECELVKIDISCHVQGDIVIECLSLNDDMEREVMMFRVVFNTAFIRSNNLMLNHDEVDTLWHIKEQFPKGFRVELLFSDMVAASSAGLMDLAIANAAQQRPDGNSDTTSQDATELLRQESPPLKFVHHSATVKPFVQIAEENNLKSPSPENNGKGVSFSPSTPSPPHPVRASLPPPPPPLPIVASQPPPRPPLGKPRAPLVPPPPGPGVSSIVTPKPVLPTIKLKPFYWLKLAKAGTGSGSIWDETPMSGGASKAPDINRTQLQICFTAVDPVPPIKKDPSKPIIIRLIDSKRAQNCEIMLSNVKIPLQDLMSSVLNLDESALDADKVENLMKFCPTTEEKSKLKAYDGDKNMLGKCELFLLEMMNVPRVEKKLRVFSYKIQFCSQSSQLRDSLNVVNSTAEQIKNSEKLKRIMQTILAIGNALNQGTNRGNAVGFKLDSLPKLSETRSSHFHKNLMHYLCWILSEKSPELLDFSEDLFSLEPATKIQPKFLADEMQAINKGLGIVVEELSSSEKDGPISSNFNKIVKEFHSYAEAEVRSLASFYSEVGRNVDGLIRYFGEDPAKFHFEKVVSTLLNFVRLFNRAHEENIKQIEAEAKKNAEKDKMKTSD